jgi:tetratricopeptide (TPR) repeat protein
LKPGLARANYFYARVLKEEGQYDEAAKALQAVLAQYPQDRVVHNELGRVLFLQKRYADAVKELQKTLDIDPEDLQANYNLMLCYTGLGDETHANEHRDRYLRFKADESAQALTGAYRQLHPEDNNERQPIHEHESVPLGSMPAGKKTAAAQAATPKKPAAGAGR